MEGDPGDLLVPLSELGLESVKGHADARGWPVLAANGVQTGQVHDVVIDTRTAEPHAYVIRIGGDSQLGSSSYRVLVPAAEVRAEPDERRLHLDSLSWTDVALLPRYGEAPAAAPDGGEDDTVIREPSAPVSASVAEDVRMTLFGEEMSIGKRTVDAGEAVIRKRVATETVREVIPTMREEVEIERRPLPEGAGLEPRIEGDVTYIPIVREELVVEKRLVAREELVVRKRRITEETVIEETLRRDEVEVIREPPERE